jgi:integration host factor subunit beta
MATVTKKQLAEGIADAMKVKRSVVKDIVQHFLDAMVDELAQGNRLEFRDFGVFEVRIRKPRMAQNPRTLKRVPVPVKCTVKFKVGRLLKGRVQEAAEGTAAETEQQVQAAADAPPTPSP